MKILWKRGSRATLVMAGPSLRAFDDYLALQAPLPGPCLNMPPVTDQQKCNLLAAATVVVQPSRVESFGLICLEAWANAKPVVMANTAISRELVEHGVDGLLAPFGNPQQLADEIDRLLQSADFRQRMGEAGRRKLLARYSWDAAENRIRPYFGCAT